MVKKRKNLSKEEIKSQMDSARKVAHIKEVVKRVFPLLNVDSIYDAQTSVNALAGLITAEIEKEAGKIRLNQINVDLSSEKDSKIKKTIISIIENFPEESAQELSETLERLGDTLQAYAAHTFLKNPLETIKITDLVSE